MVDASAVARVLGISVEYVDLRGDRAAFLPQRIAVVAQGTSLADYELTKRRILSAGEAGSVYGFGSPIHLIARELFPENGDGVGTIPVTVYPLAAAYDASAEAAGTITPGGSQTTAASYRIRAGGVLSKAFTIPVGASVAAVCDLIVAAINEELNMPIVATDGSTVVNVEAKWAGETGNSIVLEVIGDLFGGTFTIVQPSGGLVNPPPDDALAQMGGVWETMVLNSMNSDDTETLDAFQAFGEGRWDPLVRRPFVAFVGDTQVAVNDATAITATRKDDRINSQLVAPGSPSLPFVVCARQLARIAKVANNNPPKGYGAQRIDRIVAGEDVDQWDYATRDAAVKDGCSTVEVVDGVITIGNVVTMYHPDGEAPPAYRNVVHIVRLQNCIFNYDIVFGAQEWADAPLIPNDQATVNPEAKKPSMVLAASAAILDGLGDAAIISDPTGAKRQQTCVIDSGNPDRWNLVVPFALSGNTTVKDVSLKFGFFFGGATG